jgi:tRNA wybutosine-synthesizing protein 4
MANILTQIVGEKEVIIFHPSMVNELDIPPGASSSRIPNIFTSELRNKGFNAILKPGDAIYIPPLWPHATKPLTPNVGVNVFWKSFKDDLYDRGKDIYGNMDLMGYSVGRQLISRMVKEFKGVHVDVKNFYLKRLAAELEEASHRFS